VTLQTRKGEERIGETDAARILVVVTAWRGQKVRVLTAFPANQRIREFYRRQKEQSHGGKT
jgi:uncharacterized DUF497 family protein